MADTFSCAEDGFEPYDQVECPTPSGMGDAIFFDMGVVPADYMNVGLTALDEAKIQTLLNDNRACIVLDIRMGIDAPSAIAVDVFRVGGPDTVTIGYDRTVTLKDGKVNAENVNFWNKMDIANGKILGGMVIHETNASRVTVIDEKLYVSGGRISPEALEAQRFEKVISYRDKDDAPIFPDNPAVWLLTPASA